MLAQDYRPALAIIDDLKQLQTALRRDLSNVGIWRPEDAMLDRLRFALNRGTVAAVRSILEASLREDRWSLEGFFTCPIAPPSLRISATLLARRAARSVPSRSPNFSAGTRPCQDSFKWPNGMSIQAALSEMTLWKRPRASGIMSR